jgi:hypothetical protein
LIYDETKITPTLTVLWIPIRIRSDPKLFAGSGQPGSGMNLEKNSQFLNKMHNYNLKFMQDPEQEPKLPSKSDPEPNHTGSTTEPYSVVDPKRFVQGPDLINLL